MRGTVASAALLARVRSGQVGGVILFGAQRPQRPSGSGSDAVPAGGGAAPVASLPLLIAVDQEGGTIRRFRWAPPPRSAAELGQLTAGAGAGQGKATAAALRAAGVNVDLAPVADVPQRAAAPSSPRRRARSRPTRNASPRSRPPSRKDSRDGGVAATAKHFPGLGRAARQHRRRRGHVTATRRPARHRPDPVPDA